MFDFLFTPVKSKEEKFVELNVFNVELFLVLHKTSNQPLSIFDNFEKAREYGRKGTYCNCVIYKFRLNDKCSYTNVPIYED